MMDILSKINGILWGTPSLILLFGTGLFLTFVLKGLQFRRLIYAFQLGFSKNIRKMMGPKGMSATLKR